MYRKFNQLKCVGKYLTGVQSNTKELENLFTYIMYVVANTIRIKYLKKDNKQKCFAGFRLNLIEYTFT